MIRGLNTSNTQGYVFAGAGEGKTTLVQYMAAPASDGVLGDRGRKIIFLSPQDPGNLRSNEFVPLSSSDGAIVIKLAEGETIENTSLVFDESHLAKGRHYL